MKSTFQIYKCSKHIFYVLRVKNKNYFQNYYCCNENTWHLNVISCQLSRGVNCFIQRSLTTVTLKAWRVPSSYLKHRFILTFTPVLPWPAGSPFTKFTTRGLNLHASPVNSVSAYGLTLPWLLWDGFAKLWTLLLVEMAFKRRWFIWTSKEPQ